MRNKNLLLLGSLVTISFVAVSLINPFGKAKTSVYQPRVNEQKPYTNADDAIEHYKSIRLSPAGVYDEAWLRQTRNQIISEIRDQNRVANMVWEDRGPDNVGGRTRAICIDRNDANHVFAGSVGGGLFESWNGGNNWSVVSTFDEYLRVSSMCQTVDGTYYVGTGSSFDVFGSGEGIWSSTDNGATWTQVPGSTSWTIVNELTADPVIADKIWIAGSHSPLGFQTYTPSGGFVDLPGLTGASWMDNKVSPDGQVIVACKGGIAAYVSTDAGASFNQISATGGNNNQINSTGSRMEMAISWDKNENNKWTVYASTSSGTLRGVFISESNGEPNTWYEIAPSASIQSTFHPFRASEAFPGQGLGNGQGSYDHILSAVPGQPGHAILGGVEMYKWKKSSTANPVYGQWAQTSLWFASQFSPVYAHADEHELKWDQNGILYMGSDGGVTKSFDKGENIWVAANKGYNTVTTYGIGFNKYNHIICGNQDNGCQVNDYSQSSTGLEFVELRPGGDGFDCDISHIAPNVFFFTSQSGTFMRTEDLAGGQNSFDDISPTGSGPFFSVARLYENPNDLNSQDSIMYIANKDYGIGDTIFTTSRTQQVEIQYILTAPLLEDDTITIQDPVQSIYAAGPGSTVYITRHALRFNVTPTYKSISTGVGTISCIEFSSDGNYMYVGGTSGVAVVKGLNTFYSPANDISGVTVTSITGMGSVNGIGVDPNDPDHIVVAAGNNLRECINATTATSAAQFPDITASLTALPTYDAIIDYLDPNKIVMGTEFGIYATDNGGTTWTYQPGPGLVPVYAVRQQWRTDSWNPGVVYVGTFGRGMWSSNSFVGIHEQDATAVATPFFTEIKTYPNPMNTNGTISFDVKERGNVDVYVMDLNGKVVMTKNLGTLNQGKNTTNIDVTTLASGNYIVTIVSGKEIGTDKLVVTH